MSIIYEKYLSMPIAAKSLAAINIGAFFFVLTMQYGYGLHPCVLCLWQRIPYGVALAASLLALFWKPYRVQTSFLLALCAVAYLTGMGIAFFHTGVEQHWWLGTSGCAVPSLQGSSPEDLRETLLKTVAPRCDEVTWTFFGLSMANLNVAFSFIFALFAGAAAAKNFEDR